MMDSGLIRKIIHVDMDAFFASVEQRDDPSFESKAGTMRETNARTCLTTIARSVGVGFSVEYQIELRVARMPPDERLAYRQRETELAEHRQRLIEDGWQYQEADRTRAQRNLDG